jgi:hypothetical protein
VRLSAASGVPSIALAESAVMRSPYDCSVYIPGDHTGIMSDTESWAPVGTTTSTSNVFDDGAGSRMV